MKASGGSSWQVLGAALLANVPDLDLLAGLIVKGDSGAFHRTAWTHSPQAAVVMGALAGLLYLGFGLFRWGGLRDWPALRVGLLVVLILLTHPLLDYWLVNPLMIDVEGKEGAESLLASIANWLTDTLFYGAIAGALLALSYGWRKWRGKFLQKIAINNKTIGWR